MVNNFVSVSGHWGTTHCSWLAYYHDYEAASFNTDKSYYQCPMHLATCALSEAVNK